MRTFALSLLIILGSAVPALAQRAPDVDFRGGWSGFADESIVHHATLGAAARFRLGNRVSLGPEIVYMLGPGRDRDVFANAVLVTNLRGPAARVMPYAVVSAGAMWHRGNFTWFDDWYRAWNVNGGLGVRVPVGERLALGGEARVGSELELRLSAVLTVSLR